ncbi:hypothetical protein M0R45_000059 [Rubus argutus]|uniref:Uncharacterized protein n=1 Tax=Rubus argutus TaxID=59490 RepID=A0AAW1VQE2_RUBAR
MLLPSHHRRRASIESPLLQSTKPMLTSLAPLLLLLTPYLFQLPTPSSSCEAQSDLPLHPAPLPAVNLSGRSPL